MVAQWELAATHTPSPCTNINDTEEVTRQVCAIALAGDYSPYGSVEGVRHSLDGFMHYLGAHHLSDLQHMERQSVYRAIWLCLRGVPERRVTEVARIICRVGEVIDDLQDDWASVAQMHPEQIRRVVELITTEPVAALYIMGLLGVSTVRPTPSGGSAVCLMRIGLVSAWEPNYFSSGFMAVREEARRVLERLSPEHYLAAEWWGTWGCDGDNEDLNIHGFAAGGACPHCPAMSLCVGLANSLI